MEARIEAAARDDDRLQEQQDAMANLKVSIRVYIQQLGADQAEVDSTTATTSSLLYHPAASSSSSSGGGPGDLHRDGNALVLYRRAVASLNQLALQCHGATLNASGPYISFSAPAAASAVTAESVWSVVMEAAVENCMELCRSSSYAGRLSPVESSAVARDGRWTLAGADVVLSGISPRLFTFPLRLPSAFYQLWGGAFLLLQEAASLLSVPTDAFQSSVLDALTALLHSIIEFCSQPATSSPAALPGVPAPHDAARRLHLLLWWQCLFISFAEKFNQLSALDSTASSSPPPPLGNDQLATRRWSKAWLYSLRVVEDYLEAELVLPCVYMIHHRISRLLFSSSPVRDAARLPQASSSGELDDGAGGDCPLRTMLQQVRAVIESCFPLPVASDSSPAGDAAATAADHQWSAQLLLEAVLSCSMTPMAERLLDDPSYLMQGSAATRSGESGWSDDFDFSDEDEREAGAPATAGSGSSGDGPARPLASKSRDAPQTPRSMLTTVLSDIEATWGDVARRNCIMRTLRRL